MGNAPGKKRTGGDSKTKKRFKQKTRAMFEARCLSAYRCVLQVCGYVSGSVGALTGLLHPPLQALRSGVGGRAQAGRRA